MTSNPSRPRAISVPERRIPFTGVPVLWVLLFVICWGLGYPTLNRYDPRGLIGTPDAAEYYRLVTGGYHELPAESPLEPRPRLLVPLVAHPVYLLAKGHVGSWEPAFFGLLVANALFCSLTACLLIDLGSRVLGEPATALLGGALYLLNFAVANLHLSGYVDSGEACALMALAWCLFTERLWTLPLLGGVGIVAKETFLPLSAVFCLTWWWFSEPRQAVRRTSLAAWMLMMQAAALATIVLLWSAWSHRLVWPWEIALEHVGPSGFVAGLLGNLSSHEFAFVVLWPALLGLWGLGRISRPWVAASLGTALVALLLSARDNGVGNSVRPIFNAAGPVLSLAVAVFLTQSRLFFPRHAVLSSCPVHGSASGENAEDADFVRGSAWAITPPDSQPRRRQA